MKPAIFIIMARLFFDLIRIKNRHILTFEKYIGAYTYSIIIY